jgi:hypothetical protein
MLVSQLRKSVLMIGVFASLVTIAPTGAFAVPIAESNEPEAPTFTAPTFAEPENDIEIVEAEPVIEAASAPAGEARPTETASSLMKQTTARPRGNLVAALQTWLSKPQVQLNTESSLGIAALQIPSLNCIVRKPTKQRKFGVQYKQFDGQTCVANVIY